MLNYTALTKVHSILLITIIVAATLAGGATYLLLSGDNQTDTIKIGVLADLDGIVGGDVSKGAVLAAEQINAEGGILGKQVEVIGEDHDIESGVDMVKVNSALTRLLTFHEVDFVIGASTSDAITTIQGINADHKRIFFEVMSFSDSVTQRVLDDYESYKYTFRVMFNATSVFQGITDSLLHLREITGFNKVGYLAHKLGAIEAITEGLDYVLPEVYGFDLVYKGFFTWGTIDFSSYFAQAEAAGVEILLPLFTFEGSIAFVKEYFDRQSPMVIYGGILAPVAGPQGWELTGGKCEYTSSGSWAMEAGYPLTSKTLPAREAYFNRWGEIPAASGIASYDTLRFILPDAIERAGTIETDAVIEALEETSVETGSAENFVFTLSHDIMMGENPNNPDADYTLVLVFQWQNGQLVPVYPEKIMDRAGATYKFPDWPGPWD